jgi:hypothetical protein
VTEVKKRLAILLTTALLLALTACQAEESDSGSGGGAEISAAPTTFEESRLYATLAVVRSGELFTRTVGEGFVPNVLIGRGSDFRNGVELFHGGVMYIHNDLTGIWAEDDGSWGTVQYIGTDFVLLDSGTDTFRGEERCFEEFNEDGMLIRYFFDGAELVGRRVYGFDTEDGFYEIEPADEPMSFGTDVPDHALDFQDGVAAMSMDEYTMWVFSTWQQSVR